MSLSFAHILASAAAARAEAELTGCFLLISILTALSPVGQRRAGPQRPGVSELKESDVFAFVDRLKTIAGKVLTEMENHEKASEEQGEVAFDAIGHARYITPSANLLKVPDETVTAAMDALDHGAANAALIHGLMLAEVDVVLQRWRVALAAGLAESRVQLKSPITDLAEADH